MLGCHQKICGNTVGREKKRKSVPFISKFFVLLQWPCLILYSQYAHEWSVTNSKTSSKILAFKIEQCDFSIYRQQFEIPMKVSTNLTYRSGPYDFSLIRSQPIMEFCDLSLKGTTRHCNYSI